MPINLIGAARWQAPTPWRPRVEAPGRVQSLAGIVGGSRALLALPVAALSTGGVMIDPDALAALPRSHPPRLTLVAPAASETAS